MIDDLADRGITADAAGFEPLAGGRTNRVWAFHAPNHGRLVLKLYDRPTNNPLFRNDPLSERLCLGHLDGTGLAPQPLAGGRHGNLAWLIYRHVAGQTWDGGSAHVARLLQRVHRLRPPQGLPLRPGGSLALSRQALGMLNQCPFPLRRKLMQQAPCGHVAPTERPGLVHGDPVPGNILTADGRAVLIDWQCPVVGDPAEDLAVFLSPAMQFLYRGAPLSAAERRAFLRGYSDRRTVVRFLALEPWFLWRMAAYCLWQAGRGKPGYDRAFRLERAALVAHMRVGRAALPTET